jgi:hypothetical protein
VWVNNEWTKNFPKPLPRTLDFFVFWGVQAPQILTHILLTSVMNRLQTSYSTDLDDNEEKQNASEDEVSVADDSSRISTSSDNTPVQPCVYVHQRGRRHLVFREELVVQRDAYGITAFPFPAKNTVTIGRKTDLGHDIVIRDSCVSATHCLITHHPLTQKLTLLDENSTNGTFLNEQRLRKNTLYPLRKGDVIRIHTVELVLR